MGSIQDGSLIRPSRRIARICRGAGPLATWNGEELGVWVWREPLSPAVSSGQASRLLILVVIVLLFLLVIFVGLYVASQITRPVVSMVSGMGEVDRGNYDVQIPTTSNDEIALLARSFNTMVSGLKVKVRMEGESAPRARFK